MQQLHNQLDDVTHRIEILKAENTMPKRLEVVSLGEFPVPVQDRRMKIATMSGGATGGVAFGLMVLGGLVRRRYNHSAELTEDFFPRTPFVAAIPDIDVSGNVQGAGKMPGAMHPSSAQGAQAKCQCLCDYQRRRR